MIVEHDGSNADCQRWRDRRASYRPARETIRVRDFDVYAIADDLTARRFVEQHHYSGSFPAARERFGLYALRSGVERGGGAMSADTKNVSLPHWMFETTGQHFLVGIQPDGLAFIDGGHDSGAGVAKARELHERLHAIRKPRGTRYLMVTVSEVPAFRGALNEDAVQTLNRAPAPSVSQEPER